MTGLGVTGLKKIGFVYLLGLFGEGEEEVVWFCDLVGLILVLLMSFSRMVSKVLVLRGVAPTLVNGYGI